jgi:hypothetical protein
LEAGRLGRRVDWRGEGLALLMVGDAVLRREEV